MLDFTVMRFSDYGISFSFSSKSRFHYHDVVEFLSRWSPEKVFLHCFSRCKLGEHKVI